MRHGHRVLMASLVGLALVLVLAVLLTAAGRADTAPPTPQEQLDRLAEYWLSAQKAPPALDAELPTTWLDRELLAKADPDECFNGVGLPYDGTVPTCEYGVPKVNQAYVWGLAKPGDDLWFGTAPNVHCLVMGSYLGITTPITTESYVCEFGASQVSPPLPEAAGDWRPPDIFRYETGSRTLSEVTPADLRIGTNLGIRSAGTLDGVVLLGGPSLLGGIDLFAFDATTGTYLGSTNLPDYSNIRKWLAVDGVLYAGVRDAATGTGHVLRWRGSLTDLFQFEVVGNVDSEVAELAVHEGRLFVTTWPNLGAAVPVLSGLYMSPLLPSTGLTGADADGWEQIWQASDYEPDPVTAATYGGGALHSFDGYLYWGTMHVPFVSAIAHFTVYGTPDNAVEAAAAILGTHRAVSIFRGQALGTEEEEIELLYGATTLPVYVPDLLPGVGAWLLLPNNMATAPLWGAAGFDNFYNNYTWTMRQYADQLFVGTMDYSYLIDESLPLLLALLGLPPDAPIPLPEMTHGADLYRFPAANEAAVAESLNGVGNPSTYGVRTMIASDALYLGMANPMNLLTDPMDSKPEGGWELLRLAPPATAPALQVYLPLIQKSTSPTPACEEGIINGGFETDDAWERPVTAYRADYSTAQAHGGSRSMRVGIVNASEDTYSYSSARQLVSIPADAESATLRFWLYSLSGEASTDALAVPQRPLAPSVEEAALEEDAQYVLILDESDEWIGTVLWQRRDDQEWTYHEADLLEYAGQTIKLHFGVYNDGEDGATGIYVDDVSLETCTTPAPNQPPHMPSAPSPSDQATGQPTVLTLIWAGGDPDGDAVTYDVKLAPEDDTPDTLVCDDVASPACDPGLLTSGTHYYWQVVATDEHSAMTIGPVWEFTTTETTCEEVIINGDFEIDGAWERPVTAYRAAYSTAQAHGGSRSMRVGIVNASEDTYSYSSARQLVSIPADAESATLRFWLYSLSREASTAALAVPQRPLALSVEEAALEDDAQYVLILDEDDEWIGTVLWQRRDDQEWTYHEADLLEYAGQTIKLHFGVYNDGEGGATGMYVDDVSLVLCSP